MKTPSFEQWPACGAVLRQCLAAGKSRRKAHATNVTDFADIRATALPLGLFLLVWAGQGAVGHVPLGLVKERTSACGSHILRCARAADHGCKCDS